MTDKSFPLTYCHQVAPSSVRLNYQFRDVRCVMLRHAPNKMLSEAADTFTIRRADTMEWLGEGDTKEDAAGEARYRLMKQSEAAFEAAQAGKVAA
jgi:hypothetical protein